MPDKLYFNFSDISFWCTAAVIFGDPYFKSMIGVLANRNRIFSSIFGPNVAFFTYIVMSYMYSAWAFVFFKRVMMIQPHMTDLQRNDMMIIGYTLLIFGLGLKIYTYLSTSITTIMGGHYFKIRISLGEARPSSHNPYYHPLGTSSVMCYFGCSLIQRSIAGLFLSIILAVAYYLAFHFERFLASKTRQQESQLIKHTIHHSCIPPPIRSNRS